MAFFSIIVPAFNEAKTIKQCLDSLVLVDYPGREIIVVDDGSSDNTAQIADRYKGYGIKVVKQDNKGRAAALNKGVSESKGDIILCIDADTIVMPDLIKRYKHYFDSGYDAVGGDVRVLNSGNVIAYANGLLYLVFNSLFKRNLAPNKLSGAALAIKKKVLLESGGFSELAWWCEDLDLSDKLKHNRKIIFATDIFVYISEPNTIYASWKQKYQYGLAAGLRVRRREWRGFHVFLRPTYFLSVIIIFFIFKIFFRYNAYIWLFFLSALIAPIILISGLSLIAIYKYKEYSYLKAVPLVGFQFFLRELSYTIGFLFGLLKYGNRRASWK